MIPADLASPDKTPTSPESPQPRKSGKIRLFVWSVLAIALFLVLPPCFNFTYKGVFFAIITLFEVVLLFNILIIVHELGHFLAAKWCGLKIEKFAIWMGKPIWSKRVDGIDYILGSIPAGGYVALPQMAPMEALEGKGETPREQLPPASPGKKIIVAFAGPLFSFLLALFFACIVWQVGKPVSYSEATTVIGFVVPGNPADKAGLRAGDKILSIDNHPINRFMGMGDSVIWRIITSTADTIPVVVKRGAETLTIQVTPERDPEHENSGWWQRAPTRKIGIGPAWKSVTLKKVLPNSPAELAGLKPGDQLVAMNGEPIYAPNIIYYTLKNHPQDPIKFQVVNGETSRLVTVQPETPVSPKPMPKDGPQTDIGLDDLENSINNVYPTPFEQVRDSVQAVTGTIAALFTPKSNVGPSLLSGPVGIMNLFFAILSSENGWKMALWFAVLINVNLALLNLLPLPVLDGGHITLAIIEWIRRRPLSMSILEPLQTACALLLIGYMLFITFFDLQDSGRMAFNSSGGGEIKFAPKGGSQ